MAFVVPQRLVPLLPKLAGNRGKVLACNTTENAAEWSAVGLIVDQGAVAATTALGNTSEQTLATITLPAGIMGANGQVEIESLWSYPTSANNKILRTRFGGSLVHGATRTTTRTSQQMVRVSNRNVANSQVSQASGTDGYGAQNIALTTTAIDTASAVSITLTGHPASAAEQITLESWRVLVWPKA